MKQQAGFDLVAKRLGRIRHKQFCDMLRGCGIPCEVTDIDNAKRQEFKPRQTTGTHRVLTALHELKFRFPELEIDLFLTEASRAKLQDH